MAKQPELSYIPIVDLLEEIDASKKQVVENVARDIVAALREIGFVYVLNHGIDQAEITDIFRLSKDFFDLGVETKKKYKRGHCGNSEHGYVEVGVEKLDPYWRYQEIRESFNVTENEGLPLPDEVPDFSERIRKFYTTSTQLASRLLHLIGIGLKLEDPQFLVKCHNNMTGKNNSTTLRVIHYPPVVKDESVIRCGEHSDYGSITLLFQDNVGGLQVRHRDGSYVEATPIEGCVLVNVGDLLERWTADKLVSTKHRVLNPKDESLQKAHRYSVALFVHPDKNVLVECLDSSKKYPAVTAENYLIQRLEETYTK